MMRVIPVFIFVMMFSLMFLPVLSSPPPPLDETIITPTVTTTIYMPFIIRPQIIPTPMPQGVFVLGNHSTWQRGGLDRTSTYLYGEIFNNTSDNIKPLEVTVNFYDDQGQKLETIGSTTFGQWFNVLLPGKKSCFYIVRGFYHDSTIWDSYDFEPIQYEITTKSLSDMSATGIHTATEYSGLNVYFDGHINSGVLEGASWWAKASLYNEDGEIISCKNVGYIPETISSGATTNLKVTYSNRNGQFPDQDIDPFDPAEFRLDLPGDRGTEW